MKTKTIRQTVTFKAQPMEVYDMLMDSKKHKSLSGEEARISKKVGGCPAFLLKCAISPICQLGVPRIHVP
jgi:hypothetical protein